MVQMEVLHNSENKVKFDNSTFWETQRGGSYRFLEVVLDKNRTPQQIMNAVSPVDMWKIIPREKI